MDTHAGKNPNSPTTKCLDCRKFVADPKLGHLKCAKHRSCSGSREWLPNECEICMLFKHNVMQTSGDEMNKSLNDLYQVLQDTSNELGNDEVTWEYEENFYNFMEIQRPDRSSSHIEPLEEGEIPENSESPENGDNTSTPHKVKNQSDLPGEKSPSTNDILNQLVFSFNNLTERLGPIISSKQKRENKTNNRSRKRRRSPSPATSEDEIFSENSNYLSDTDQHSVASRSPSPPISKSRTKRRNGDGYFNEGSTIYFYRDDRRVVSNKVWFNDELREVKWHPTIDAFSLVNTPKNESPFMSNVQAHESLVSYFHAQQDHSEKPGLDRKSYRVPFDENSGLAKALRLIKQETPSGLHNLYIGKSDDYWKSFSNSAFKTTSMVNFSSGWTHTGTNYLEWAKNDKLNTLKFSQECRLHFTPSVPNKFLEAECKARAQLVDSISGLAMLDSLAKAVQDNGATHTAVEAISRHYLSILSDTTLRWIKTKIDVRKIVLQGSTVPQATDLLESNVWEPTVFGHEAVKELKANDVPRLGIDKRLNIKEATNKFYTNNPKRVIPEKLGKQTDFNRNQQTTQAPSAPNQFFRNQHSPIRFKTTTQNNSQFNSEKQFQTNNNSRGQQYKKAGNNHQTKKRGGPTKSKVWNKQKPNASGSSGFTKGNQNTQQ